MSPRSSSERKVSPHKQKSPKQVPAPKPKPKATPKASVLSYDSSDELVPDDPGQPSQLPHTSGSPEPESAADSDEEK